MAHPDWVLKHKMKNTEIRLIKGKYYLYERYSKYCPKTKKARKVTGKYLGTITESGFKPKGFNKIPETNTNLMDHFQNLDDPRSNRGKIYPLVEIILVAFLSIICGAEGFLDMENFGKLKLNFLKNFYQFKHGSPSDDTFRRLFSVLNPEKFKAIFVQWVQSLSVAANAKLIAIDGKASRHTFDNSTDTKMLHTVSAYATDVKLVFGQEKVDEKSNEITAIPKLLDLIDVKNAIVTIDAMGCQYLIADMILKKNGDYIFSLKGNQGSLNDDVRIFMDDQKIQMQSFTDTDKGHGRIEVRTCTVSDDVAWLKEIHKYWQSIQSLIKIESTRTIGEKKTTETRYYISSAKKSASELLHIIRSHWGIENQLHWTLDMTFNEDASRIRKGHSPLIMTMMRHVAFNLLMQAKPKRQSIKSFRKMCALDDTILVDLISKKSLS